MTPQGPVLARQPPINGNPTGNLLYHLVKAEAVCYLATGLLYPDQVDHLLSLIVQTDYLRQLGQFAILMPDFSMSMATIKHAVMFWLT